MRPRRSRATILAAVATALLCGCASGLERPEILVSTAPPGAACTLSRLGQPIATVAPTPAIALVDPSGGDITILCRRPGFADTAVTLPAGETGLNLGFLWGRNAHDNRRRVDIALKVKSPSAAPR